jgi:glutamyl-tRNA reductase
MEDILLVHRKSNINFDEGFKELFEGAAIFGTCLRKIFFCEEVDLHQYLDALKPEDQIRKISKQEANKVCVDCPEKVCGKIYIYIYRN